MKKRLLSLFLVFILAGSLPGGSAWAAGRKYINLGTVDADTYIDLLIGKVSGTAECTEGSVPDGCSIYSEDRDGTVHHYLRGTPSAAGLYEFTVTVSDQSGNQGEEQGEDPGDEQNVPVETPVEELVCSITVRPSAPVVNSMPMDVSCYVGDEVRLEMVASAAGAGSLSYQWFSNPVNSNHDGSLMVNGTGNVYIPDTSKVCSTYYYCEISHTENGLSTTVNTTAVCVSVSEPVVTSISVNSMPSKTQYTVGDSVDTNGLLLQVKYAGGASEIINSGFGVYPNTLNQAGTQTITISYKGNNCSFDVQVEEAEDLVEEIRVSAMPTKTEYFVGDWLDTAGMKLRVFTRKGYDEVSTGFSCSPTILDKEGIQTVTVYYSGKSCTFEVKVAPAKEEIRSLSVLAQPGKLIYTVGEALDTAGLVLHVETNFETRDVVDGFTCSPTVMSKAGTQEITVSYLGKTCTFTVTVNAAAVPSPEVSDAPEDPAAIPTATPSTAPSGEDDGPKAGALVTVIAILAVLALGSLGAYVYMSYILPRRKGKDGSKD